MRLNDPINRISFKKLWPWMVAILGFVVLAYAYTPQVLGGKIVNQADISSWWGMANEIITWNEAHPDDPTLWTNSMFSGMPADAISVLYEGDWTEPVYKFLFTGARPASYLLISLIGGFLLMLAFGANLPLACLGAIAITFCSYNMQIIQVGHNSKMAAIAFMPWVLGAVVWAYRKKAVWGAVLFAFALSFQIKANHPQITYYLALVVLGLALAEGIVSLRNKTLPRFIKTSMLLLGMGLLGIATNANHLLPTFEYAKQTMRGGSELTQADENGSKGLDLDYATAWSYGIEETPNLMIPNFNGGASAGELSKQSASAKVLRNYSGGEALLKQMPLYWGPQPFTAGPMYMGALSIFLAVLALCLLKNHYKWWIVGVGIIGLFLSWGSHFMWFSELWFRYVPMYNKFRTVSMILVILQLLIPILGMLVIKHLLYDEARPDAKALRKGFAIAGGLTAGFAVLVGLFPGIAGSFISPVDANYPEDLVRALVADRQSLLRSDAFRSLLFIVLGGGVLWLGLQKKLKADQCVWILALLTLVDLWGVDKRYLNDSHFIRQHEFQNQFAERPVDTYILADEDPNYRVLDLSVNTFNDAHTSYHHKTIGGYSPAKLQRYQDLIEYYISPEMDRMIRDINGAMGTAQTVADLEQALQTYPILSMLNTRYVIINGNSAPLYYAGALGNAWFVQDVVWANNPNEEIETLGTLNPATTAVLSTQGMGENAEPKDIRTGEGLIYLTEYAPNALRYVSESNEGGLGVFSEIYYPNGWKAFVDGEEVPVLRANYVLRAIEIPAGRHEITFRYDPPVFKTGKILSRVSSILIFALLALALLQYARQQNRKDDQGC